MLKQSVTFSSLWLIRWIVKARSSASTILLPDAWRGAAIAIILIDALIFGFVYVLYAANSLGLVSLPIFNLAEPLF